MLEGSLQVLVSKETINELAEGRAFIEYVVKKGVSVYGITTGVGDLREISLSNASLLSQNLIRSHDAGIGKNLPENVVLGAMIISAHSLAQGRSGFSPESLNTLVEMINAKIIPEIPSSGSLGASGDLAFLARLGRAMMGDSVWVNYQGSRLLAGKALNRANIPPFEPKAKEGLALINGTSFMASMLSIAHKKQMLCLNALIASMGLFLNATRAVDAAFYDPIHVSRKQSGQRTLAKILMSFLKNSKLVDRERLQNDYCIRCIPQILGPRIESILNQTDKIECELNAITDNPLIFKDEDLNEEINESFCYEFNDQKWSVLSGGNFHGENLTTIADGIALANAKIALTLERQLAYLLNPERNRCGLPCYLVPNGENLGLKSGFMIPHYTANALVHKICLHAQPSSLMNCTSANEAEDLVSYGATACHKLLDQIGLLKQLLVIHLLSTSQAYSLIRQKVASGNDLTEEIFSEIQNHLNLPLTEENGFKDEYSKTNKIIESDKLKDIMLNPLQKFRKQSCQL